MFALLVHCSNYKWQKEKIFKVGVPEKKPPKKTFLKHIFNNPQKQFFHFRFSNLLLKTF
jgi:hypothetical protein